MYKKLNIGGAWRTQAQSGKYSTHSPALPLYYEVYEEENISVTRLSAHSLYMRRVCHYKIATHTTNVEDDIYVKYRSADHIIYDILETLFRERVKSCTHIQY